MDLSLVVVLKSVMLKAKNRSRLRKLYVPTKARPRPNNVNNMTVSQNTSRDKRLGTNGQQIANNPWGIDWSCDR